MLEKTLTIFPSLLEKVLQQIENGSVKAIRQDPMEGRYYKRRYPRDSRIDWQSMDDIQVNNLVRGMHGPYPAAFTFLGDTIIEIDKTKPLQETTSGVPGRVLQKRGKDVIVGAKNRGLLIEKITVNGKPVDPAKFLNIDDDLIS